MNIQHSEYVNPAAGIKSRQPRKPYAMTLKERAINMDLEIGTASHEAMKRRRIMILLFSHSTPWSGNQAMRAALGEPRRDESSMRLISFQSFRMFRRDGYRG